MRSERFVMVSFMVEKWAGFGVGMELVLVIKRRCYGGVVSKRRDQK